MSWWAIGFILGGVITVVVAVLLVGIAYEAWRILRLARVASVVVGEIDVNTRSIWALRDTNSVAEALLEGACMIDANAGAIAAAVGTTHTGRDAA